MEIEFNSVKAVTCGGLFGWGGATVGPIGGTLRVRNNTVQAACNSSSTAYRGAISLQSTLTLDAAASADVANNALIGASDTPLRLPTGGLNDARWVLRGNSIVGAPRAGYVGVEGFGTAYATVAALQAAHNAATANREDDPLVNVDGRPLPGSPLLTGGADLGLRRDRRGYLSRRFIGAYGPALLLPSFS